MSYQKLWIYILLLAFSLNVVFFVFIFMLLIIVVVVVDVIYYCYECCILIKGITNQKKQEFFRIMNIFCFYFDKYIPDFRVKLWNVLIDVYFIICMIHVHFFRFWSKFMLPATKTQYKIHQRCVIPNIFINDELENVSTTMSISFSLNFCSILLEK